METIQDFYRLNSSIFWLGEFWATFGPNPTYMYCMMTYKEEVIEKQFRSGFTFSGVLGGLFKCLKLEEIIVVITLSQLELLQSLSRQRKWYRLCPRQGVQLCQRSNMYHTVKEIDTERKLFKVYRSVIEFSFYTVEKSVIFGWYMSVHGYQYHWHFTNIRLLRVHSYFWQLIYILFSLIFVNIR